MAPQVVLGALRSATRRPLGCGGADAFSAQDNMPSVQVLGAVRNPLVAPPQAPEQLSAWVSLVLVTHITVASSGGLEDATGRPCWDGAGWEAGALSHASADQELQVPISSTDVQSGKCCLSREILCEAINRNMSSQCSRHSGPLHRALLAVMLSYSASYRATGTPWPGHPMISGR